SGVKPRLLRKDGKCEFAGALAVALISQAAGDTVLPRRCARGNLRLGVSEPPRAAPAYAKFSLAHPPQSRRSAAMGSMAVARRAGNQHASNPVNARTAATAIYATGSRGFQPSMKREITRLKAMLPLRPITVPMAINAITDPATSCSTCRRWAPRA